LEEQGHTVITVNLPAHGADTTAATQVTLQQYVDVVKEVLQQQSEKVILVGHSMGGMVVSAVAEALPEKIEYLVYVSAYLPQNGEDLLSLASQDSVSLVGKNLEFTPDYAAATIKTAVLTEAICDDCPQAVKNIILQTHKAEPAGPLGEKAALTLANFGAVPKYYISTTQDKAVGYPLQQQMVANNGSIKKVFTMETSHLPFLAQPAEFVRILQSI
jgi:pimeloyl-ACP methyl ester carboxylesterase